MSETDPTGTVTITTGCLAAALGSTISFAHPSTDLPSLHGVQVRASLGHFTATASDRYVIGRARRDADGALPRKYLLHLANAERLRNAITSYMELRESSADPVTITAPGDSSLRFQFGDIAMTLTEPEYGDNLPDLDAVLDALPETGSVSEPVGLAPRVLEPLVKAAEYDQFETMRWTFDGPLKPVRVDLGSWFLAAVMPVRLQEKQSSALAGAVAK